MARINPTVRTWLVTFAVVAVLLGGLALAGGFAPRDPAPLRVEAGREVSLSRWDITVEHCEVEPDDEADGGDVRIHVAATNRWDATLDNLSTAVGVDLPTGELFGFQHESFGTRTDSGGGFDPGFPATAYLRISTEQPLWEPSETVRVSLYDEASSDGYISNDRWYPASIVAVVDLECTFLEVEE